MRGATTSVELVNPDVAIVLESDIAGDVPDIKPEETAVKMGKGPTILMYDARMIPNLRLQFSITCDPQPHPAEPVGELGVVRFKDANAQCA